MHLCVCSPPIPIQLWCDHFQTLRWSGLAPGRSPKSPLLSFPHSNPFSNSLLLFILFLLSSRPTLCSSVSHYHLSPFSLPSSHSLLHLLPQSFQWCSPFSSPGRSQSFLTANREGLGFSRLSLLKLLSPSPYPQKHAAGKCDSLDNRES